MIEKTLYTYYIYHIHLHLKPLVVYKSHIYKALEFTQST